MKFGLKVLFYGIFVGAWILVLGLFGEVYESIRWGIIEKHNPQVKALGGKPPWFDSAPRPPVVEETPLLPVPDAIQEWQPRAEYFLTLGERERSSFVNVYCIDALLIRRDGIVITRYTREIVPNDMLALERHYDGPASQAIRDTLSNLGRTPGVVRRVIPGARPDVPNSEVLAFPLPEQYQPAELLVFWRDGRIFGDCAHPTALWEISFIAYNKHASVPDRELHTNNYGFRDSEVAVPKPSGVFRVVCVGGSTTEEGPDEARSYPNLVEQALNGDCAGGRIEVINCGIPGLSTAQARMRLPDYCSLQPDMLVIYMGVNDLVHFHMRKWVEAHTGWQKWVRSSRLLRRWCSEALLPSQEAIREDLSNTTLANIAAMARYAESKGIMAVVCSFAGPRLDLFTRQDRDYMEYVNAQYWCGKYIGFAAYNRVLGIYNAALKEQCEDSGIPYLGLAEAYSGGVECFTDICHMRSRGIVQKAEIITRYLKDLPLLKKFCSPAPLPANAQ